MSLASGSRLGPYEILGPLGKGGMGEVYRARDPRMGREVAIKVSAERFSQRFSREVHAIAALNHPNVCALYDVGEDYLVMELVEGPTLSQRLAEGPLPLEEALGIAGQIGAALEAAHEKGIVHRDLKPGNIKLRPDGAVKVLDFGLAKSGGTPTAPGEDSPTLSMQATQAGVILGTAAYMAPEQARGKPVDKRADIWAFGVVLYEMATGRRLFQGEDLTDTLAAVVKTDPDLSAAPARLRRLLKTCLEKDPARRLRDIGDMKLLLEPEPEAAAAVRGRGLTGWIVAAAVAVAALAGWWRTRPVPAATAASVAFAVRPDEGKLAPPGSLFSTPLISPDGSSVIFNAGGDRVRRLDAIDSPRLATKGMRNQGFWSADSEIFFFADSENLNRLRVPDGAIEIVGKNIPGVLLGGTVSENGTVLFSAIKDRASLYTVPAAGGEIKPVKIEGAAAGGSLLWPQFLSNGEDFLYLGQGLSGESSIYLATLRDGAAVNPVTLMKNDTAASYTDAGGGRILFVRDDNLYAQGLDVANRKLLGEPDLVQRGVASAPGYSQAHFTVSRTGVLAWRPGRAALSRVTIRDRKGAQLGTAGPPLPIQTLSLSPDESHLLAFALGNAYLLEPNQPGSLKLGPAAAGVIWLPDSASFLDLVDDAKGARLVQRSIAGAGQIQTWPAPPGFVRAQDLSPDGKTVLFNRGVFDTGVFAAPLKDAGPESVRSLVDTGETILNARFSPDGRWISYQAAGRGVSGTYVQPFPGPGVRKQLKAGPYLQWRKSGGEILFLGVDYRQSAYMWSLPVSAAGADLRFGEPQMLFPVLLPASTYSDLMFWAVSRDGSRFYFPEAVEQPELDTVYIRTGAIR